MGTVTLLGFIIFIAALSECSIIDKVIGKPDKNNVNDLWGEIRVNHGQSPINIVSDDVKEWKFYEPLTVNTEFDIGTLLRLKNEGHGPVLSINGENGEKKLYLSGGILPCKYYFNNLHVHWNTNNQGSEHSIDSQFFSIEGHLVFWKEGLDFKDALQNHNDGIVALGFFGQVVSDDEYDICNGLTDYLDATEIVHPFNLSTTIHNVLTPLLKEITKNSDEYYLYPGALTSPNFYETVTFFLLPTPVEITQKQLDSLRQFENEDDHPIPFNKRFKQFPLQDRPIKLVAESIPINDVNCKK